MIDDLLNNNDDDLMLLEDYDGLKS